jgi:hypothetical protein
MHTIHQKIINDWNSLVLSSAKNTGTASAKRLPKPKERA